MADKRVDAAAIRAAVDIFYGKLLADPALRGVFRDVDMPRLKGHQRAFVLQALGGASLYAGRDLQTAHLGLQIDDAQFTVALAHLVESLREVGVADEVIERAHADIEELRGLIVAKP